VEVLDGSNHRGEEVDKAFIIETTDLGSCKGRRSKQGLREFLLNSSLNENAGDENGRRPEQGLREFL
jgi:hypothetical protein